MEYITLNMEILNAFRKRDIKVEMRGFKKGDEE